MRVLHHEKVVSTIFRFYFWKRPPSRSARESFVATHLASKGVPAKVIQRILRHRNLATTERYIGRADQDLAQSMKFLATDEKVLHPVLPKEKEGER